MQLHTVRLFRGNLTLQMLLGSTMEIDECRHCSKGLYYHESKIIDISPIGMTTSDANPSPTLFTEH